MEYRPLVIVMALCVLLVPVVLLAQGGPATIATGQIKTESSHGKASFPWELKGEVMVHPSSSPECTATSAGVVFAGAQTQILTGYEPRALSSTMTITATDGQLPASAQLSIWGEATVTYSDSAASSTRLILNSQVVANGETREVRLDFAVPTDAVSVELAVRAELRCGGVLLASQTQLFVWHPRTYLPQVQNQVEVPKPSSNDR